MWLIAANVAFGGIGIVTRQVEAARNLRPGRAAGVCHWCISPLVELLLTVPDRFGPFVCLFWLSGTLWEPGELAFQQDLQRKDPKAFKALLERNGMEYNPNYVRGT